MPMHAEHNIVMTNLSVVWYCTETNPHIVKLFPLSGRAWL